MLSRADVCASSVKLVLSECDCWKLVMLLIFAGAPPLPADVPLSAFLRLDGAPLAEMLFEAAAKLFY